MLAARKEAPPGMAGVGRRGWKGVWTGRRTAAEAGATFAGTEGISMKRPGLEVIKIRLISTSSDSTNSPAPNHWERGKKHPRRVSRIQLPMFKFSGV